jgi:hypothetical protein
LKTWPKIHFQSKEKVKFVKADIPAITKDYRGGSEGIDRIINSKYPTIL